MVARGAGGGVELAVVEDDPFRAGAGPDLLQWHVEHEADRRFWGAQRESLFGRAAANVAVVGDAGLGKSHRLQVAAALAAKAGAFHATHRAADVRPDALVARLASAVLAGQRLGRLEGAVAAPRWYRNLAPVARRGPGRPESDGEDLARAVNANTPAFLLIDDLHRVPAGRAGDRYLRTLERLRDGLGPGTLLAWTCGPERLALLAARFPGLVAGATQVRLAPLRDADAVAMVAARLRSCRVVDGMDGLHPFTASAIGRLNQAAQGSPRRLLRLAELLVESARRRGAFEVDDGQVDDFLGESPLQRARPRPAPA